MAPIHSLALCRWKSQKSLLEPRINDLAFHVLMEGADDAKSCWLTYSGRFTHINSYPSAAGPVQTSESSPVRDRRSTTELPNSNWWEGFVESVSIECGVEKSGSNRR